MRLRGSRLEVGKRQLERQVDKPIEAKPPGLRVDLRDVEVDQEVVQPDRRDRVTERLERQPMVAGRKLQLVERYLGRRAHGRTQARYSDAGQGGTDMTELA